MSTCFWQSFSLRQGSPPPGAGQSYVQRSGFEVLQAASRDPDWSRVQTSRPVVSSATEHASNLKWHEISKIQNQGNINVVDLVALGKQMWSSDHLQISLGTNQCSQPRGQIRQTNSQEFQRHPKSSAKRLWLKSCPKVSFARASGRFTSFAFSVGPIHSSLPLCFLGWIFCPRLNMVRREAKWFFPCPNYQSRLGPVQRHF